MLNKLAKKRKGFTLIEILVVIGIIAILATIVIIAINPARQFKQARDTQRLSNLNAILNTIGQNIADNKGTFICASTTNSLPQNFGEISSASTSIYDCIVPTYMPAMVCDPSTGVTCSTRATYDTGYQVMQATSTGRITVTAPGTELPSSTNSVSR